MLKASIVVPIYNAGEYIERCAPSLVGQSLGPDAYEVIYVNDGSTDDSAKRLDELAEKYPHVRVYAQENSGWPGKPRNVGVRMARGEYVQFVDQDDEIAGDALERLYDMAVRNDSDIVFGKTRGHMQGPVPIFRHTREKCGVADADLFDTLTPHKMFRRQFLLDNGIEFPEGRVRLEDQLFLARAYPKAKNVSILGDVPTYHWRRRDDGGNNSSRPPKPEDYYTHVRNVVRAIKENSEPGEVQDRMLRRSYRVEVLRPVTEPRALQRTGEQLERYFKIVRDLVLAEFPPGVGAGFPAINALRAHLLEQSNLDGLVELARRTKAMKLHVEVGATSWRRGKLHIPVKAWQLRRDGKPLALVRRDGKLMLDPEFIDGVPGVTEWEVKDPFLAMRGSVLLRDTERLVWWFAENDLEPRLEPLDGDRVHVVMESEAVIDPMEAAGGQPLESGRYEIWLDTQVHGIGRRPRLTLPGRTDRKARVQAARCNRKLAVGKPRRLVVAHWGGKDEQLELLVAAPQRIRLGRGIALRLAADDRVRTSVKGMVGKLPSPVRARVLPGAGSKR
ncbi:Glycosyl transferase family 2 [Actinacidiphila yanglinensis]|uniref:Glycosyl transferase family 2 n=1 Tax=Actinacidiphila yanglinensis TaxID=310779 RepID=A0A1H5W0T3_9ACTN|nr:glycosyltransferase [Actinacidiphila yanglinensis]SEF92836.1 Glycosyl transferase family 2 [Actinacidiphila yanglinensis]